MGFLDDIERIQNAKKALYDLMIMHGAIIDENTKLDEYQEVLQNLLSSIYQKNQIQYGYINNQGKFQKIDLSNQEVVNVGEAINIESVLYKLPLIQDIIPSSSSSSDTPVPSSSSSSDMPIPSSSSSSDTPIPSSSSSSDTPVPSSSSSSDTPVPSSSSSSDMPIPSSSSSSDTPIPSSSSSSDTPAPSSSSSSDTPAPSNSTCSHEGCNETEENQCPNCKAGYCAKHANTKIYKCAYCESVICAKCSDKHTCPGFVPPSNIISCRTCGINMEKESLENHNCATPCPNGLWCEVVTCYCGAKYCSHCYSHPDTGVCCSNRSSCMYSVVSCPANCGEHFCTAHQYHFGTVCCPKNTNDGHIYQKCTKCQKEYCTKCEANHTCSPCSVDGCNRNAIESCNRCSRQYCEDHKKVSQCWQCYDEDIIAYFCSTECLYIHQKSHDTQPMCCVCLQYNAIGYCITCAAHADANSDVLFPYLCRDCGHYCSRCDHYYHSGCFEEHGCFSSSSSQSSQSSSSSSQEYCVVNKCYQPVSERCIACKKGYCKNHAGSGLSECLDCKKKICESCSKHVCDGCDYGNCQNIPAVAQCEYCNKRYCSAHYEEQMTGCENCQGFFCKDCKQKHNCPSSSSSSLSSSSSSSSYQVCAKCGKTSEQMGFGTCNVCKSRCCVGCLTVCQGNGITHWYCSHTCGTAVDGVYLCNKCNAPSSSSSSSSDVPSSSSSSSSDAPSSSSEPYLCSADGCNNALTAKCKYCGDGYCETHVDKLASCTSCGGEYCVDICIDNHTCLEECAADGCNNAAIAKCEKCGYWYCEEHDGAHALECRICAADGCEIGGDYRCNQCEKVYCINHSSTCSTCYMRYCASCIGTHKCDPKTCSFEGCSNTFDGEGAVCECGAVYCKEHAESAGTTCNVCGYWYCDGCHDSETCSNS